MTNLFIRMFKIILLSLFSAVTTLIFLYVIIYTLLIEDQADDAKTAVDAVMVMKCSKTSDKRDFDETLKRFGRKTGMQISVYSLFENRFLSYDEDFIKRLKRGEAFYKVTKDKLIYYKPMIIKNECMKCHGGSKVNGYSGFEKGALAGVLEVKLPINEQMCKYRKTFFIIFLILGIALILTLYFFYDYMKTIRKDIGTILIYFREKVKKGVYEPLGEKMEYSEFEKLKNEINSAVESIVFYKNEMLRNYLYNELTNLPNRIKLIEDLQKEKFNLAILNVNKFREINDYFGQEIGDWLISMIRERIKKLSRAYHINVDEFAVPLPYGEKRKNYSFVMKIIKELEKPYHIKENEIVLTFRCGMSKTTRKLLTTADIALEYAKRKKQKCLCFCEIEDTIKEFEKNLKMLNVLVKAIKNGNIIVYYQPIIDNNTLRTLKYEALVRIRDEKGKIYTPDMFLDIAKRANLYPHITICVFKKALEKFRTKKESVSLNLDMEDFQNAKIRTYIKRAVENFPQPERITIELLENENITESENAIEFIKYLKSKGVQIFIDDFGSGYSNFSYLFNFEMSGFKIDGSLIKNILTDRKSEMIVETMVEFARKGNMKVIAEYVENESIFKKVKSLGVDCSQGYYFSEPVEII
ncbi:EAL domain-containing protein [Nautilia sp.]